MIFKISFDIFTIRTIAIVLLTTFIQGLVTVEVVSQEVDIQVNERRTQAPHIKQELSLATTKVDVKPVARDEEIRQRLQSVLKATEWYEDSNVRVEQGVVFLSGETETDD